MADKAGGGSVGLLRYTIAEIESSDCAVDRMSSGSLPSPMIVGRMLGLAPVGSGGAVVIRRNGRRIEEKWKIFEI